MDEILVAVAKGGELAIDLCLTFYEKVFSDEEDEGERSVADEPR
ncbi:MULTISPECIES: hypothetical protein [Saliphagus]|uniref:Uncharacterized protein n=1 Tax=Saliphagus infecundisoli TaxID=1849069 RepID=A0ABD5QF43_9EURY|nr:MULTISPECIES: hypothetical protein [Saliphagus]